MKAKINVLKLQTALATAGRFTEKKDMSYITSHYLFEADSESNTLKITATDYEMALCQIIRGVDIFESGSGTVEAKFLNDVIKPLKKDETVLLETAGTQFFVRESKYTYNGGMFASEDFPNIKLVAKPDEMIEYPLNIDSSVFKQKLGLMQHAVGKDEPKISLNGVFVGVRKECFAFAASNTKVLSYTYVEANNDKTFELSIPKRAVAEMQKLFVGNEKLFVGQILIDYLVDADGKPTEDVQNGIKAQKIAQQTLIAYGNDFIFTTHITNDKFPDFERIIPRASYDEVEMGKKEVLDTLKRLSVVTDRFALNFRKEDNKLVYQSNRANNKGIRAEFDKNFGNLRDNFHCYLNLNFVKDFLNTIEESSFKMKLLSAHEPIVFVGKEFSEVIMPFIGMDNNENNEYNLVYQDQEKYKAWREATIVSQADLEQCKAVEEAKKAVEKALAKTKIA